MVHLKITTLIKTHAHIEPVKKTYIKQLNNNSSIKFNKKILRHKYR